MLTSIATRGASASPGAASASAARDRRQAITVAGMMQKDDGDLDEDDFLWEKLPGRCCFYGYEDPKDASRWIGAKTCEECSVWSEPDNYCHTSRDACEECGMRLYCAPTPPLITGQKVCTGASRVGHGCDDDLGTGVCAGAGMPDCQDACRRNAECEMFVFYVEERQGAPRNSARAIRRPFGARNSDGRRRILRRHVYPLPRHV